MRVASRSCWEGDVDGVVEIFSIATNYNPWVEDDWLREIEKPVGPTLGEPRWFVETESPFWNKGMHEDLGELPTRYLKAPYNFHVTTPLQRKSQ